MPVGSWDVAMLASVSYYVDSITIVPYSSHPICAQRFSSPYHTLLQNRYALMCVSQKCPVHTDAGF